MANTAPTAASTKMTARATACAAGSRPDATGHDLLYGCRRSRSASATSLIRETAEDASTNAAPATTAYQNPPGRPSVSPASGAAKTRRFFGHWRGLVLWMTAQSQRTGPGRRAVVPLRGRVTCAAGVGAVIERRPP